MSNQMETFCNKRNKTANPNSQISHSSQSSTCNKTKSNLSVSIISAFRFLDYDEIKSEDNIQPEKCDSVGTREEELKIIETVRSEKKPTKPEKDFDAEIIIIDDNDNDCKIINSVGKWKNGKWNKNPNTTRMHSSSRKKNKNNVPSSMSSASRFSEHDIINIHPQKRKLACRTENDCEIIRKVKPKKKLGNESGKDSDVEITIIEQNNLKRMANEDCKIIANVRHQTFNGKRNAVADLSPPNFRPSRSSSYKTSKLNSSPSYSVLSAFRFLDYENTYMQSNVHSPQKRDLARMVEDDGKIVTNIRSGKKFKNEAAKELDEDIIIIEDSDSEIVEDDAFEVTLKNATELYNLEPTAKCDSESPGNEILIPEEMAFQQLVLNTDPTENLNKSEIPPVIPKICTEENSSSDFNYTSYLQKYLSTNLVSRFLENKNLTKMKDKDQPQKRDLACTADEGNQINESLSYEEKLKKVVKEVDENMTITGENDSGIVEDEKNASIPFFNDPMNNVTKFLNLQHTPEVERKTNNNEKVEETNVSIDTINVAEKNTTEFTNLELPIQEKIRENIIELFKEKTSLSISEIDVQINDTTKLPNFDSFVKEQIEKIIEIVEKDTDASSDIFNITGKNTNEFTNLKLPMQEQIGDNVVELFKEQMGENIIEQVKEKRSVSLNEIDVVMNDMTELLNLGSFVKEQIDIVEKEKDASSDVFNITGKNTTEFTNFELPEQEQIGENIVELIKEQTSVSLDEIDVIMNDTTELLNLGSFVKEQIKKVIEIVEKETDASSDVFNITGKTTELPISNNAVKNKIRENVFATIEEPVSSIQNFNVAMKSPTKSSNLGQTVKYESDCYQSWSSDDETFTFTDIAYQQRLITADPKEISNETEVPQISSKINENITPKTTTKLLDSVIKEQIEKSVINKVEESDSLFHPFNIAMNDLTESSNLGSTLKYECESSQSWSSDNEMSSDVTKLSYESEIRQVSCMNAEELPWITANPKKLLDESAIPQISFSAMDIEENSSSDFNYISKLNEIVKNRFNFDSCEIGSCGKFCNIMLTKLNHFKNKTQTARFILQDIEYELKHISVSENCTSNGTLTEGRAQEKGNVLPEEEVLYRLINCGFETDSENNNLSTISPPNQNSSTASYGIDQIKNIDLSSLNIPPGLELIFKKKNDE